MMGIKSIAHNGKASCQANTAYYMVFIIISRARLVLLNPVAEYRLFPQTITQLLCANIAPVCAG